MVKKTSSNIGKAKQFIDILHEGLPFLCHDLGRYLQAGVYYSSYRHSPLLAKTVINECMVPHPDMLEEMREAATLFSAPISPIGLTTHYATGIFNLSILLIGRDQQFHGRIKKGIGFPPSDFLSGPSLHTGLWIVQSLPAAMKYQELHPFEEEIAEGTVVFTVMSTPIDESGKELDLPPKDPESIFVQGEDPFLYSMGIHEGHHSFFRYMRRHNPLNTDFATALLDEVLAYREQVYKGKYTREFVTELLIRYYFKDKEAPPEYAQAIRDCVRIACAQFDPIYQAEITWRGMITPTIWEFIQPSTSIKRSSRRLARLAREDLIPYYLEQITL